MACRARVVEMGYQGQAVLLPALAERQCAVRVQKVRLVPVHQLPDAFVPPPVPAGVGGYHFALPGSAGQEVLELRPRPVVGHPRQRALLVRPVPPPKTR